MKLADTLVLAFIVTLQLPIPLQAPPQPAKPQAGRAPAYRHAAAGADTRVKNSLQFIGAMVSIEARSHKSGEGKAALERVSHRIKVLGQLYSTLSKAETVENVDAATYLDELCHDLIASVRKEGDTSVMLKADFDSELLPTDRAIPIGLS